MREVAPPEKWADVMWYQLFIEDICYSRQHLVLETFFPNRSVFCPPALAHTLPPHNTLELLRRERKFPLGIVPFALPTIVCS